MIYYNNIHDYFYLTAYMNYNFSQFIIDFFGQSINYNKY